MLVHRWDAPTDDTEWATFLAAQGFGHLVASGRDRDVPIVVPTQFVVDHDEVLIHLAERGGPSDAAARTHLLRRLSDRPTP
jgi:transcriptional regulator